MILHIINKSPLQYSALNDALPFIESNDKVVLIDDGVYAAVESTGSIQQLRQCKCECFVLLEDIQIRGITVGDGIKTISMADFVDLVFVAEKNISWY